MGSDCGGGWSPGGGSPERNRGRSPVRNRGKVPFFNWGMDDASQFQETRDGSSSNSSSTSPARDRNLRGLGINPKDYQSTRSDQQASTSGTLLSETEQRSVRLREMRTAVNVLIERRLGRLFLNRQGVLRNELSLAASLGVKPMHADDPGFENIANQKENRLKWAVTTNGDLLFVPHSVKGNEISHTVLTQGESVMAAGEAYIAVVGNTRYCTEITNYSGHYRPDEKSLEIGKEAFKIFGITFLGETKESDAGDAAAVQKMREAAAKLEENWEGRTFASTKLFTRHYNEHAKEWSPKLTEEQYLAKACELLSAEPDANIEGFVSESGKFIYKYNNATNEFTIGMTNGAISTFYKPVKGRAYWLEEIEKNGGPHVFKGK